jgi:hypothetical protein
MASPLPAARSKRRAGGEASVLVPPWEQPLERPDATHRRALVPELPRPWVHGELDPPRGLGGSLLEATKLDHGASCCIGRRRRMRQQPSPPRDAAARRDGLTLRAILHGSMAWHGMAWHGPRQRLSPCSSIFQSSLPSLRTRRSHEERPSHARSGNPGDWKGGQRGNFRRARHEVLRAILPTTSGAARTLSGETRTFPAFLERNGPDEDRWRAGASACHEQRLGLALCTPLATTCQRRHLLVVVMVVAVAVVVREPRCQSRTRS